MKMSNFKSIEQERANFVYKRILSFEEKCSKNVQVKINTLLSNAPILILTNGLSNVLAFYISKIGSEPDKVNETEINQSNKTESSAFLKVYKMFDDWLSGKFSQNINYTGNIDLSKWCFSEATSLEISQATQEIMRLNKWAFRFRKAILPQTKGEEDAN